MAVERDQPDSCEDLMQRIPPPTSVLRLIEYVLAVDLVAFFATVLFLPPESLAAIVVYAVVLVVSVSFLLMKAVMAETYAFDEKGVYSGGRLLFAWLDVKRVSLRFKEEEIATNLVAQPTWNAVLSGGPIQRAEYVGYSAAITITLEKGETLSIPANLDKLTDGGVFESIDETAKAANPRIEFV